MPAKELRLWLWAFAQQNLSLDIIGKAQLLLTTLIVISFFSSVLVSGDSVIVSQRAQ